MMDNLDSWWKFKYSKKIFSRSRNSNSSFSFWWLWIPAVTGATEEYDGTTWTSVLEV
jgi:hypothetical protein